MVTATIVGEANTGGNTIVDEQPPQGGSQVPALIDTGDAEAVGSLDANVVTQGAEIALQDQATANVIQVALIINIGVALANSGYNGVTSAPGAGIQAGITTGDASAEGLDIDQYITQAAREEGDEDTDDMPTSWRSACGWDSASPTVASTERLAQDLVGQVGRSAQALLRQLGTSPPPTSSSTPSYSVRTRRRSTSPSRPPS